MNTPPRRRKNQTNTRLVMPMDPAIYDQIKAALPVTLDPNRVRAALALKGLGVSDIAKLAQRTERMTRKVLMGEKTSAYVLDVFRVTIGKQAWQFVTKTTDALWAVESRT